MANVRISTAANQAAADAIADLLDAGAAAGTITIYTSPQPANANTAITTQTQLAQITLADPAFDAADSTGRVDLQGVPLDDTNADATGTAAWARWRDSNGNTVFDCDVGTSGATLNLNTTSIVSGGVVSITSFYLQHPDGT